MKRKWLRQIALMSSVCLFAILNTSHAGYAVAGNDSASVIYSGTKYTPVPKFLTKQKAMETQRSTGAAVRVSYNIDHGKTKTLQAADSSQFFYYNTYTNIIAVANVSQDAIDLSELQSQVFYAVVGDTLSETLTRWAKMAGYQLDWGMPNDYRIQYSYTFYGDLTAESGPLNQILKSFEHSANAMRAKVTENNVIMILPNEYVPAAVVGV